MLSILDTATRLYRDAADVRTLVGKFERCTLAREDWTHAAHLTVALWYSMHYDAATALELVRRNIKRYNEATGVANTRVRGYHETLTVFWMHTVRTYLETSYNEGRSLASLANELVARADKDLPLRHYSRARLFSLEARANWVEPDLEPLDDENASLRAQDGERLARQHVEA
jgi:hypothetical protein